METQKLNNNASSKQEVKTAQENKTNQGKDKNSKWGNIGATAAAGVFGGAFGGVAGNAMAGNREEKIEEPAPGTVSAQEYGEEASQQHENVATDSTPVTPSEPQHQTPDNPQTPTDPITPEEVVNEIISGEFVDPRDVESEQLFNIDEVSVLNIEGNDYNVATITDEYGNEMRLVDVDGEAGDVNGTFDIMIDAETGEMLSLNEVTLTVGDAVVLAQANHQEDPGYYHTGEDSIYNDIAMNEVEDNIVDPCTLA